MLVGKPTAVNALLWQRRWCCRIVMGSIAAVHSRASILKMGSELVHLLLWRCCRACEKKMHTSTCSQLKYLVSSGSQHQAGCDSVRTAQWLKQLAHRSVVVGLSPTRCKFIFAKPCISQHPSVPSCKWGSGLV